MQALILVAESGGPTMLAKISVMWALNRHYVPSLILRAKSRIGVAASLRDETVWIYTDLRKQVGDTGHLEIFATVEAWEIWFADIDPEGVAFEYDVIGPPQQPQVDQLRTHLMVHQN